MLAKCLVIDYHAGCISSTASLLADSGKDFDILSLSGHGFVLEANSLGRYLLRGDERHKMMRVMFPWASRTRDPSITRAVRPPVFVRNSADVGTVYQSAFVSFPPGLYRRVLKSNLARTVNVIVAHRADLHISGPIMRWLFWRAVKRDLQNPRVKFAAANLLDAAYFKTYTGVDLPIVVPSSSYLRTEAAASLTLGSKSPLVASHAFDESNGSLRRFRSVCEGQVSYLRELYPKYQWNDLLSHRALIYIPYSAYSISLTEYLNLGLPVLIPTDEWLVENGLVNDVQLFPLYGRKWIVKLGDFLMRAPKESLNRSDSATLMKWLSHATWNEPRYASQIFRWSSPEELLGIIHSSDFKVSAAQFETSCSNAMKKFEGWCLT